MAPSFLFSQFMGGLTTAMFLFLIASGLSLVFGIMRVINFAHGSFYMLGAYLAWQGVEWVHPTGAGFWIAALFAATGVGVLGAVVERLFFRQLYGREELYQLLFTYALVLILGDVAKFIWGTGQLSVSTPPVLAGSIQVFGTTQPIYNLFMMTIGPAIAFFGWLVLNRTGVGRLIRSEEDRGVVMICDPRLMTRGYGRALLASLPAMRPTREASEAVGMLRRTARQLPRALATSLGSEPMLAPT